MAEESDDEEILLGDGLIQLDYKLKAIQKALMS